MAEGHREAAPRVLDGREHDGTLAAEGRRPTTHHIAVYPRILTAANRQCPADHDPIVARQYPCDPIVVALRQRLRHAPPNQMTISPRRLHQTYWFRLRRLRANRSLAPVSKRTPHGTCRRVERVHP